MRGSNYWSVCVTVACGCSLSGVVDTEGSVFFGVVTPAAINCATSLTFQVSDAATGTFVNLYDDCGSETTLTVAASRGVGIKTDAVALSPFRFLKLRMGTSGTPVVAACGAKTFKMTFKG